MDFSKFLDDDFNVTTWVNDAFRAQRDGDAGSAHNKRDIYAATLVTKLQVFIQEVNKSLEDMSTQVVNSMPRVLRDIEALKQEATYLKQQMKQVKDDIHDVESKTSHTMKVLVQTDQIRSRVEKSCAALREADNWSSLAAAIEDVFRSGDSITIAARLQSMQNSLEILKDSPDYDDKVMHLEALKNRLESHVSPQAVTAFKQHNTEEAKSLQTVFSTIGRENELHKYYIKTYSTSLVNQWQEIVTNDEEDDKPGSLILNELFDLLLSMWHSQIPWCKSVFGARSATFVLVQVLNEVLLTSKPSIGEIIAATLESNEEPKMLSLVELHKIARKFALRLGEAIEADEADVPNKDWADETKNLIDSIWVSFITFQGNFKEYETDLLLTQLSEVVMDAGDLMDLTRVLDVSADKVFIIAMDSIQHCKTFTNFFGSKDLIHPLNAYFHNYTDKFSRALRTVNIKYGLNTKDSGDLDISEEHYYSLFQHSLRIITTCGKLLQLFSDFELKLVSEIINSDTAVAALTGIMDIDKQTGHDSKYSAWTRYDYLSKVDAREYRKLQDMLVSLKQSPPSQRKMLPTVEQALTNLNQQAHQLAFDIAFAQIKKQLAMVPHLKLWSTAKEDAMGVVDDAELPAFSLPPTEYATTVGQLLMTLPQHLEPIAASMNEGGQELSAMETALHTAKLPFSAEGTGDKAEMENMADRWLSSIVRASEHTYVEACLQIPSLTAQMSKQLAADLDYMGNVVDSLGLPILKDMSSLITLLRAPEASYADEASKAPKKLSSGVARVRGLKGC